MWRRAVVKVDFWKKKKKERKKQTQAEITKHSERKQKLNVKWSKWKVHEEIEKNMKCGQTKVENMLVVDWREVQRLSSLPLTVADSMIHELIYIHATLCEPAQSSLPSCEVQVFILPFHLALFISLFISRLKISLVFRRTLWGRAENSWMFFVFFLYSVMCCGSEWILPPGCYARNYLICLKLKAKSWQLVPAMSLLIIFGWFGQRLVIMVPFHLCSWLTNTVKPQWIMTDLCCQNMRTVTVTAKWMLTGMNPGQNRPPITEHQLYSLIP